MSVSAMAAGACMLGLQAGAGLDLWSLSLWRYPDHLKANVLLIDPSWSGVGWDQHVSVVPTWAERPCLRLGLREQVIWHNISDKEDAANFTGTEWQFITQAMVGTERALPWRFSAGAYLLPGLRAAVGSQQASVPARDLDEQSSSIGVVPVLYASAVVRWWPLESVGVHADTQFPLMQLERELNWFPNRLIGAGLDLKLPPAQTRR